MRKWGRNEHLACSSLSCLVKRKRALDSHDIDSRSSNRLQPYQSRLIDTELSHDVECQRRLPRTYLTSFTKRSKVLALHLEIVKLFPTKFESQTRTSLNTLITKLSKSEIVDILTACTTYIFRMAFIGIAKIGILDCMRNKLISGGIGLRVAA